jgi:hypothetical protein
MKWAGLFFGLNYKHMESGQLNGCINDTLIMKEMLESLLGKGDIEMRHDSEDLVKTSYNGIIDGIFKLSLKAIKDKLDLVVIHYSGHGAQVIDTSGDELDGMDEVICPSDYNVHGMLKDDIISYLLSGFPSYTRVVTIFDSCHSGTVTDLPFRWNKNNYIRENNNRIPAKVVSISGCSDSQVSLDTSTGGMLTTNLVKIMKDKSAVKKYCLNIFNLVDELNLQLMKAGTRQRSVLSSSYDLLHDLIFLPLPAAKTLDSE